MQQKIIKSLCMTSLLCAASAMAAPKVIGILVPLEHQAMTEIVNGFKSELNKKYAGPVVVEVKNAEHDPVLQRSILQQLKARDVDVVEPIGTDALEMTLSIIKHKPVVGIAAEISAQELKAMHPKHATNVLDQIDDNIALKFMRQTIPNLHTITLIHSGDAKSVIEAKQVRAIAKQDGINLQDLMVQQESDLYTISKHINPNSQAIFILKDHLVVSGIATLTKQARDLGIPLISSDDGSVAGGSVYALGFSESEIGKDAADVTAQILNGTPGATIPMRKLTNYHVFINKSELKKQHVNLNKLLHAADSHGYGVIYLGKS